MTLGTNYLLPLRNTFCVPRVACERFRGISMIPNILQIKKQDQRGEATC